MARNFSGTTDRIDYTSPFNTAGSPITISMWVFFDLLQPVTSPDYMFVSLASGSNIGTIFDQRGAVNGQLAFTRIGATTLARITSADVVTAGAWTHCLVTHDGVMTTASSVRIYVNGTETGYTTTTNGATETAANSGFVLGGRVLDDIRNFDGRIAEVGVWNNVRPAEAIASLAKGYSPAFFPDGLRFYTKLIRDQSDEYGRAGTLDGTTVVDHPMIIYPAQDFIRLWNTPASAALTGTITTCAEADIVAGGKTIILTLTGDSWVASGATFDAQRQPIIDGLDSAQAEATGWDAVVKAGIAVTDVVRTNNNTVTITLGAFGTYDITATETITDTIPGTAVVSGNAIVASPTFQVTSGVVGGMLFRHPGMEGGFRIMNGGLNA